MPLHRLPNWSAWLLGDDEKLRLRTSMAALATGMMTCYTLFMYVLAEANGIPASFVHWWGALSVGGLLAATVAVRTGLSARLGDPSLTLLQMKWALTCNAVAYVVGGPSRALVLPVLVIILMFGIFGRSRRQMIYLMAYSMVLYSAAVVLAAHMQQPPPGRAVVLAHLTIVLASVLAGTLMCLQVQRIRGRLRQQNIDLQAALAQNRELAIRDMLTGLLNRRHLTDLMHLEARRSQRSGRTLLLAQLDIDHFKRVNDTYGHAVGDRALQRFAQAVRASVRECDVLARWGGEEFVLMLTDTTVEKATDLLERVRQGVAGLDMPHPGGVFRVTMSAGLAQHRAGDGVERTLERADQALYTAKASGRNRVVVAPPASASEPRSACFLQRSEQGTAPQAEPVR
ncbi:diguanylate cyclase [Acidovorax sp. RAC01]|uniref:diguanylate cyclase n=1 Tax=Acidovorax sp. RAC01 TaxID=1842533 RepID=UPI001E53808B|nr:diguanylate cyclase [Acidovorax sp. RAC01]